MRLKHILASAVLAALPFVGIAAQDSAELPELPDLGGREVTIAVENAYFPYNYINDAGEAVGWDYDTFRDICALLNCVPVFEETSWDGMLIAIADGAFDIAADGITYTEARDETVDFSQLYQSYDETLLVRADEDRFSTVEELLALEDYRVGTQIGTTNEITAHEIFGVDNTASLDQFGPVIEALANGDVDAVVIDRPAGIQYARERGDVAVLEESISGIKGLAFAFPTGSDLVEPINAAMNYMIATGRWEQLYTRWFVAPELADLGGAEITIAIDAAYPPYNYVDENGDIVGWDIDTFITMCSLLNCTPVFEVTTWEGTLIAIANGDFDVAAGGITYTAERDETVDFSQLFQSYDQTLLVAEDEDRFTTVAELLALEDFQVATLVGTTNEITAHEIFGMENTLSLDSFGAAIEAMIVGDADAVVIDRPAADGFVAERGGLKTLPESLMGIEGLAFAFPPGSDLVEPINAVMDRMIADGTWDDIYAAWFE